MNRIEAVNDFVVKFANVNGSGSASANELFAKAVLRMGVPVAPRNIFPSNIQGLPTWYEVRVTERGWLGRRGGVDEEVPLAGAAVDGEAQAVGAAVEVAEHLGAIDERGAGERGQRLGEGEAAVADEVAAVAALGGVRERVEVVAGVGVEGSLQLTLG